MERPRQQTKDSWSRVDFSSSMAERRRELGGALCGLVAPLVFLTLYGTAVSLDPAYDFGEDYLSDLGVGPGAWAFNTAVIAAGILVLLFAAAGLNSSLGWKGLAGAGRILLALAGVALAGVGVFPEDAGRLHTGVSVAFFLLVFIALGVLFRPFWKTNAVGKAGTGVTGAGVLLGALLLAFDGSPLTETIAVLGIVVWGLIVSMGRLRGLRQARPLPA